MSNKNFMQDEYADCFSEKLMYFSSGGKLRFYIRQTALMSETLFIYSTRKFNVILFFLLQIRQNICRLSK